MDTSNMSMREVMRCVIQEYGDSILVEGLYQLLSDYGSHIPEENKLIRFVIRETNICNIFYSAIEEEDGGRAKAV